MEEVSWDMAQRSCLAEKGVLSKLFLLIFCISSFSFLYSTISFYSIYNLSLSMTYVTFLIASYKLYSLPFDWTYGTVLLRHTLGILLIALHIWTSISVFEELGGFTATSSWMNTLLHFVTLEFTDF